MGAIVAFSNPPLLEITRFESSNGPISKSISLNDDGTLRKVAAAQLSAGTATRVMIEDSSDLASVIEKMTSVQAISLGSFKQDLPDCVELTTRNNAAQPYPRTRIARTKDDFVFVPGRPGVVLLDFDVAGASDKLRSLDFRAALIELLPALDDAQLVMRRSTSAGIRRRADNALVENGVAGMHAYVLVADAADSDRFLKTLHDRAWLAGLGWFALGKDGALLERSIVDRLVGSGKARRLIDHE